MAQNTGIGIRKGRIIRMFPVGYLEIGTAAKTAGIDPDQTFIIPNRGHRNIDTGNFSGLCRFQRRYGFHRVSTSLIVSFVSVQRQPKKNGEIVFPYGKKCKNTGFPGISPGKTLDMPCKTKRVHVKWS
jgi:hypothetical protein